MRYPWLWALMAIAGAIVLFQSFSGGNWLFPAVAVCCIGLAALFDRRADWKLKSIGRKRAHLAVAVVVSLASYLMIGFLAPSIFDWALAISPIMFVVTLVVLSLVDSSGVEP